MQVGPAELLAFITALWLMCFGAAVGGRYGIIGALGGGVCGALIGLVGGFAFALLCEWLGNWFDRFAQRRRVRGILVRTVVGFGILALLGTGFFYSSRVVFASLKRMQHRPSL